MKGEEREGHRGSVSIMGDERQFEHTDKEEELGDVRWDYHLTRELVGEEAVYVLHIGEVCFPDELVRRSK